MGMEENSVSTTKITLQYVTPQNRKGVFFKSDELMPEVLLNHKPKMSITGWLKVDYTE